MADRQFQPRTKDGAAPFTAHELEAGDPRGRPGDYVVDNERAQLLGLPAGSNVIARERFEESFMPVEDDDDDAQRAGDGDDAHRRIDNLLAHIDDLETRVESLESKIDRPSGAPIGAVSTSSTQATPAAGSNATGSAAPATSTGPTSGNT